MVGGYQIIDLTNISVTLDGGAVAITDPKIKKQLLSLREYIEENYNFSKPLNNKLKPVMIRLRDAESGEEFEGCLWGNVSIIDDNLSFSIDAIVNVNPSKVLQINVVFEEQEDEVGNVFYGIKTVTYEYKGGQDSVIVTDIKNIPSATIKKLQCGDIVLKKDSSGYHAYIVSFRNATGICLTYTDATCIETQSYDKVGQNWVYNSEDKGTLPEFAPSGTIVDVLGLDSEGKLVKGAISGGTKLYLHKIKIGAISISESGQTLYPHIYLISTTSTPANDFTSLRELFKNRIVCDKWHYENPNYIPREFYDVVLSSGHTIYFNNQLFLYFNPSTNFNVSIYSPTTFTISDGNVVLTNTKVKEANNTIDFEDIVSEL